MSIEASRLKSLARCVKSMRRAQSQFFATKGNDALKAEFLKESKQLEQQTDAFLKQLEFEKLI